MSYTDVVCVLMCADTDDLYQLAQEWLDAMPEPTFTYITFRSVMVAA